MDLSIKTSIKKEKEPIEDEALYSRSNRDCNGSACRPNVGEVHGSASQNRPMSTTPVGLASLLTSAPRDDEYQVNQKALFDNRNFLLNVMASSQNKIGGISDGFLRQLLTQQQTLLTKSLPSKSPEPAVSIKEEPIPDQPQRSQNDSAGSISKKSDSIIRAMLSKPPIYAYGSPVQTINNKPNSEEFKNIPFDYSKSTSHPEPHNAQEENSNSKNGHQTSDSESDDLDSPEKLPLLPPKATNPQISREDFNAFCRSILSNRRPAQVDEDQSLPMSENKESVSDGDTFSKISRKREKGKRKFQCDICNKSYGHNSSLKVHYRVHTGERPFKCHVCDRDFSHSNSLQSHIRSHYDKTFLKCDICDMKFSFQKSLSVHMLTHSAVNPFVCGVCTKSFSKPSSLKTHMKSHTGDKPFKCDFCGEAFRVLSKLEIHTLVHTGDPPYQGNECPKKFASSGLLKNNSSIHTGIKPYKLLYKCKVCGKRLNNSGKLNKHSRVHLQRHDHIHAEGNIHAPATENERKEELSDSESISSATENNVNSTEFIEESETETSASENEIKHEEFSDDPEMDLEEEMDTNFLRKGNNYS